MTLERITSVRRGSFIMPKNKKAKSGIKLCFGINYLTDNLAFFFLAVRYQKNPITAAIK